MAAAGSALLLARSLSFDVGSVRYEQSRFRAMGTSVHLIVATGALGGATVEPEPNVGGDLSNHLDYARRRIEGVESCLSRFLPDSELCQLNRLAGLPTVVSPQLFDFVAAAWQARRQTRGSFDPTIGASLHKLGYDRPFDEIVACDEGSPTVGAVSRQTKRPIRALEGIEHRFEVDAQCRTVSCSPEVQLDLGGIAKGMTADIVAEELLQRGAVGASINIGGDIRVIGTGPNEDGSWSINLMLPGAEGERSLELAGGGVCTSAITERQWTTAAGATHHILDPETSQSATTDLLSVSVVGRTAAAAEVMATAGLVDGQVGAVDRIRANGATGLVVTTAGDVIELPGFDTFAVNSLSEGTS